MFLGEDLLAWLVLAIGGALCVGNVLALVRPPEAPKEGELAEDTVRGLVARFAPVYEAVAARFPDVDLPALWPSMRYL